MFGNTGSDVRFRAYCAVGLCLSMLAGCEDKRRHRASEDIEFTAAELDLPDNAAPDVVVDALVRTLQEFQTVRQEGMGKPGNREKYDRSMAALAVLAARDAIHAQLLAHRSPLIPKDVSRETAVRVAVESWASATAHYIHGVKAETLQPRGEQTGNDAVVFVDAENPSERERLDKLLAAADFAAVRDKPQSSPEFIEKVRPAALEDGFNVPISSRLTFTLRRAEGRWRVFKVDIGPTPAGP